jgi:hypothetical protein
MRTCKASGRRFKLALANHEGLCGIACENGTQGGGDYADRVRIKL